MASLVSDEEKQELEVIFKNIFDTFKREITVHKEPIKVVTDINISSIFGYGDAGGAQTQNVTYTPVSASFYASISYNFSASDTDYVQDINSFIPGSIVKIKVETATRDYIVNNGKTEFIELDGKRYNIISKDIKSNFLGVCYYVFFLNLAT